MIKKYVCGFMFNQRMSDIILIRKQKPAWQAGVLNGVGGKVNEGEHEYDAMIREFEEETGVHYEGWKLFAVITDKETFRVAFYAAADNDAFKNATTTEDEAVVKSNIRGRGDIGFCIDGSAVYNLNWLIPLALDEKIDGCIEFAYLPNGPSIGKGNFLIPDNSVGVLNITKPFHQHHLILRQIRNEYAQNSSCN